MFHPIESWGYDGSREETATWSKEQQQHLDKIDAIRPSGDPLADARLYDQIVYKGSFASRLRDRASGLRRLVVSRQVMRASRQSGSPYDQLLGKKCSEAVNRLLDYYQETAQTFDEFDDREVRREGSDLAKMHRALRDFALTGDCNADTKRLLQVTAQFTPGNNDIAVRLLDSGEETAERLLEDCIRAVTDKMRSRQYGSETAETRYYLNEIAEIQVKLAEKILAAVRDLNAQ